MKQNSLNYHNLGYKRTVAVRASPADSQRLAATQLWCRPAQIPESGVNEPAPAEPAGQSGHPAAGVQARRDSTQVQKSFFSGHSPHFYICFYLFPHMIFNHNFNFH